MKGFDRIAPIYDFLVHLVFGKSIIAAQVIFLDRIPAGARVLVLGGGTGKFLSTLQTRNPGCEIWFIDASLKMLQRARKNTKNEYVHFIHGTENSIPTGISFDVVVTYFYLDLFDQKDLDKVLLAIRHTLRAHGSWLVAEFIDNNRWWQRPLLTLMYFFFRRTTGLKTRVLPNWRDGLAGKGLTSIETRLFYGRFIVSEIFRNDQQVVLEAQHSIPDSLCKNISPL